MSPFIRYDAVLQPAAGADSSEEMTLYARETVHMSDRNRDIVQFLSLRRARFINDGGVLQTMDRTFRYVARSLCFGVAAQAQISDEPSPAYPSVSLSDAVAMWDPALSVAWEPLNKDHGARAFSAFLVRLLDNNASRIDPQLHPAVVLFLRHLSERAGLREACFAENQAAITECDDSSLLAFNRMTSICVVADIGAGLIDGDPRTVIAHMRQLFRARHLLNISDKTFRRVQQRWNVDRAEFYRTYQGSMNDPLVPYFWLAEKSNIELTYQVSLRERLQLFFVVKSMENGHVIVSGVTSSDVNQAERTVKSAENKTFSTYLFCSQLWQGYLQRVDATGFAETRFALDQSLEGKSTHGWAGAALCREITQRHFGALTRDYLDGIGEISLLDSPWMPPKVPGSSAIPAATTGPV